MPDPEFASRCIQKAASQRESWNGAWAYWIGRPSHSKDSPLSNGSDDDGQELALLPTTFPSRDGNAFAATSDADGDDEDAGVEWTKLSNKGAVCE